MSRFNATEGTRATRAIEEQVDRPNIGVVERVYEHVVPQYASDELKREYRSNFEIDVTLLDSPGKTLRTVEYQFPQANEIKVPKVGDIVLIEYRGKSQKTPTARGNIATSQTRPPVGRAGMWRKKVPSGTSPAGAGDLYVESYTGYDQDPSEPGFDSEDNPASETLSFIRLSKKERENDNPVDGDTLPMMLELFDSPKENESYIKMEGNTVDGDDTKSMSVDLDLKNGIIKVSGDSTNEFGLELDVVNGTFKILDDSGYGIESDGSGNFTWHYETVDYQKGSTTSF